MPSLKLYLLRSVYEWLIDSELTPYVLVNARRPNVHVPNEHVDEEGRIVLNVGMSATRDLHFGKDEITFSARFSGRAMLLAVPYTAVLAMYAKETGKGMVFSDGGEQASTLGLPAGPPTEESAPQSEPTPGLQSAPEPSGSSSRRDDDGNGDDDPTPPPKKRPALRVVK